MMKSTRELAAGLALIITFGLATCAVQGRAQEGRPAGLVGKVGTVKSVSGNTITFKVDSGSDFTAAIQDNTRILRIPAGQTDLKNATPITLDEVQVGDRMLVRGKAGETPDAVVALQVVIMKQSDVAQKQQQDLQDWQKRGVGGIASAINAGEGSITVAVTPVNSYIVRTSKDTSFLRYSPASIKFADAQKGTFDQIKVGDQLRARGTRSADGKELAAEAVISGTFRNIAGTITAIDAANNSIMVKDVLGKKTLTVRLTAESQMRKLPAQIAQRIAFLLKAPAGAPGAPSQAAPATTVSSGGAPRGAGFDPGGAGGPGAGGPGRGGAPDFQQMMNRLPAVTLADLQKDEAVMIVSTSGTSSSEVTAVTLLSGVEPILTASPNGAGAAALLAGWNLSAPGGDAAPQ